MNSIRHSIPDNLKVLNRSDCSSSNSIPSFKINGGVFDIAKKKSKDCYSFLIKKIACLPNYAQKSPTIWSWISVYLMMIVEGHFSCPILSLLNLMSKPFNLKYSVLYYLPTQSCSRSGTGQIPCDLFAKGNQKLLNISFGTALIRIHSGNVLNHIIWVAKTTSSPKCPLLNYLIVIGKIYLWSCKRNEVLPTIDSFIVRVNSKCEIGKYICTKNKSLQKLMDKWTL